MKPHAPSVQAQGLSLRAGGQGRLLCSGLDLALQAGECWVLLGPNGAGKSTLIATLAGLLLPSEGDVNLAGRSLHAWPLQALARQRAWCPQFWSDPFPASVNETLRQARLGPARWWPWSDDEDAAFEAELARVLQRLDLAHLAGADVRTLSGGERQRVAVATCLLQGVPWLLLDEPASHLDLAHQQLLVALLREHADKGGIVMLSLHDLNLAASLASHVVLMDGRGGVLAGPRAAVMTPERLSAAFDVKIDQVEVCGQQRYWIGPATGARVA
ncbi:MAG TPA: ABC transporter ATP-binding protein [Methylibium sp.]